MMAVGPGGGLPKCSFKPVRMSSKMGKVAARETLEQWFLTFINEK